MSNQPEISVADIGIPREDALEVSEPVFVESKTPGNIPTAECDRQVSVISVATSNAESLHEPIPSRKFSWKQFWIYSGPGWMMSVGFLDPGNLTSDLQAGGYVGYNVIWVLFAATAIAAFLQRLAIRLGVATSFNLAEMCRRAYSKWTYRMLCVMTEIAIIGADIQEVLGTAIAFEILFGIPLYAGCLITGIDAITFLLLRNYGIRKLEAFFIAVIFVMVLCFFANLGKSGMDGVEAINGFVPRFTSSIVLQSTSILGAIVSPQNIYFQSGLVQSRKIDRKDREVVKDACRYFTIETVIALFITFLVNFAVLVVFANGFYSSDCLSTYASDGISTACLVFPTEGVETYGTCKLERGLEGVCQPIGLAEAGIVLRGFLGKYAETIWAVGLLAAGQSTTMTNTFTGQFLLEGFLNLKVDSWKVVALTRGISLLPAVAVAIVSAQNPVVNDQVAMLLNVLQTLQLPFALFPILHFTNCKRIMKHFVNGSVVETVGWLIAALVCTSNYYILYTQISGLDAKWYPLVIILAIIYSIFLGSLVQKELVNLYKGIKKYYTRVRGVRE